jgi:hypothetical protein
MEFFGILTRLTACEGDRYYSHGVNGRRPSVAGGLGGSKKGRLSLTAANEDPPPDNTYISSNGSNDALRLTLRGSTPGARYRLVVAVPAGV